MVSRAASLASSDANAVIFFILIAVVSILQTKFLNSKEEQL